MKTLCSILLCLLLCSPAFSQYYLRGEIKDETGRLLPNVKMLVHSTGYVFYSGSSGGYGIMSTLQSDSITLTLDGYQVTGWRLESNRFENITMKLLKASGNLQKKRLISVTKDLKLEERVNWSLAGETYSNLLENEFVPARRFPQTGFAISIDKASYSNVRRFINMGSPVPPDAVRIEEMLNYFNVGGFVEPKKDSVFGFESYLTSCPWNTQNNLLMMKVCAKKIEPEKIPPSNLVFLIDISGSMDMPNRLPLLKSAFKLLVNNLRDKDTVSIVVYGSAVGVWLQPTSGAEKQKIQQSIEDLWPGGSTPGASGITMAYALAKSKFIPGGNNRVILATDGDFNVGQTGDDELENMISLHRQSGIYLTCLGVGMGNYKDSKLEVLAKKGNGNFAYLDDEREAEKVLVKELTQTLYAVADDAYLNIQFNSEYVKDYRLIGFDNKINAISDSLSELEGGEVGSGHTLLAMIEIQPTMLASGSNFSGLDPIAVASVLYKNAKDTVRRQSIYKCPTTFTEFEDLPQSYRFASSIAMFGSLLKSSKYTKNVAWNDAIILANQSINPNDPLQKEFVTIIEKAKKIYVKGRKKKSSD